MCSIPKRTKTILTRRGKHAQFDGIRNGLNQTDGVLYKTIVCIVLLTASLKGRELKSTARKSLKTEGTGVLLRMKGRITAVREAIIRLPIATSSSFLDHAL